MNDNNSNQVPENDAARKSTLNDLLSCPFCGEHGEYWMSEADGIQYAHVVDCSVCDCRIGRFETKEKALAAWNKRNEKVERMRKALVILADQDSGVVGSTKKSDCMAAIARVALR